MDQETSMIGVGIVPCIPELLARGLEYERRSKTHGFDVEDADGNITTCARRAILHNDRCADSDWYKCTAKSLQCIIV